MLIAPDAAFASDITGRATGARGVTTELCGTGTSLLGMGGTIAEANLPALCCCHQP
ncbi:MAG: hypothetical protein ABI963_05505 [Rhizomicrobium sp.]